MDFKTKKLLAGWTPEQRARLAKLESIFEEKGIPKEQRDSTLRLIAQVNGPPPIFPRTQAVREAEDAGWTPEQIEILSKLEATLKMQGMPESQRDLALHCMIWRAEPLRRLYSLSSQLSKQRNHHQANRNKGRERIELIKEAMAKGIRDPQAIHDYVKGRKKELLYPSRKRGEKGEFISAANMMKHFYRTRR